MVDRIQLGGRTGKAFGDGLGGAIAVSGFQGETGSVQRFTGVVVGFVRHGGNGNAGQRDLRCLRYRHFGGGRFAVSGFCIDRGRAIAHRFDRAIRRDSGDFGIAGTPADRFQGGAAGRDGRRQLNGIVQAVNGGCTCIDDDAGGQGQDLVLARHADVSEMVKRVNMGRIRTGSVIEIGNFHAVGVRIAIFGAGVLGTGLPACGQVVCRGRPGGELHAVNAVGIGHGAGNGVAGGIDVGDFQVRDGGAGGVLRNIHRINAGAGVPAGILRIDGKEDNVLRTEFVGGDIGGKAVVGAAVMDIIQIGAGVVGKDGMAFSADVNMDRDCLVQVIRVVGPPGYADAAFLGPYIVHVQDGTAIPLDCHRAGLRPGGLGRVVHIHSGNFNRYVAGLLGVKYGIKAMIAAAVVNVVHVAAFLVRSDSMHLAVDGDADLHRPAGVVRVIGPAAHMELTFSACFGGVHKENGEVVGGSIGAIFFYVSISQIILRVLNDVVLTNFKMQMSTGCFACSTGFRKNRALLYIISFFDTECAGFQMAIVSCKTVAMVNYNKVAIASG